MNKRRQLLYAYENGNTHVELFTCGTKIRDIPDGMPAMPEYPESIDLKITDYCEYECNYCHESSSRAGKQANLLALIDYLKPLNPGTEIALGGGDPLTVGKDQLHLFLKKLSQDIGLVPNMTIKWNHKISAQLDKLTKYVDIGYLYGIGISGTTPLHPRTYEDYPSIVHHVIAGYHKIEDIEQLPKVLILGYKRCLLYTSPSPRDS